MAEKHPVPAPDAVPVCFGDRYLDADSKCERCAVRTECHDLTASWGELHSLSELLFAAEREIDTQRDRETVEDTYRRLYRDFFGRAPRHGQSVMHERGFDAVKALPDDVDRETYIAGNMWAMRDFANASRFGFQPMMLSGERAMRRYHAYLGRLRRRYRCGKHTSNNTSNELGKVRRQLFEGEHAVAEWFVAGRVAGRVERWEDAVAYVSPSDVWTAAHGYGPKRTYHRLCTTVGTRRLAAECAYATLRAASAIAEQYQHRLADRIGVRGFDWGAFADLIQTTVQPRAGGDAPDLTEVSGKAWRW